MSDRVEGDTVLALVPARGGSVGVPGKNVADVGGRPMVAWSVAAALDSGRVDVVVVSTDDDEIAAAGAAAGAAVPFRRPADLATDEASSVAVAVHTLDWYREESGEDPTWLVLLQPTSPLRDGRDVAAAVDLARTPGTDAVVSVRSVRDHPAWMLRLMPSGYVERVTPSTATRRQDEPDLLVPNGAIYVVRPEVLRMTGHWYGERTRSYEMTADRSIDVDTPWDLELVRMLVGRPST